MPSHKPAATKVLIVHEQPTHTERLVAWVAEWGYAPATVETPALVMEEIACLQAPWLGIFSHRIWNEFGPRITALTEALSGNAPGFGVVIGQPVLPRLSSFFGEALPESFEPRELQSLLNLANQIVGLQLAYHLQAEQLERARCQLRKLEGMLPICMDCKKIRDERNRWQPIEHYISARSHAAFTHGLCPSCFQKRIEELRPVG